MQLITVLYRNITEPIPISLPHTFLQILISFLHHHHPRIQQLTSFLCYLLPFCTSYYFRFWGG